MAGSAAGGRSGDARCAACGRAIRRGRGIPVDLWGEEGLAARVCSEPCRLAYERGETHTAGPGAADEALPDRRARRGALAVLGLSAASEALRAAATGTVGDPLGMAVPWAVHVASGVLLVLAAVGLLRARRGASATALIVSSVVAVSHLIAAVGAGDLRPALVPVSLALPLVLLLVGRPGNVRLSAALSLALLQPVFVAWRGGDRALERARSIARIEAASRPGPLAGGAPGSIRARLPEGFRVLERDNGIIDWPHSELEVIEPATGAAAFVVLNPDCAVEGLPDLQARSLEALDQSGADPVVTGLLRLPDGTVELRVELSRSGGRLRSYELFRALPGQEARPGCVWVHCVAEPRRPERGRETCREIAAGIERVPEA